MGARTVVGLCFFGIAGIALLAVLGVLEFEDPSDSVNDTAECSVAATGEPPIFAKLPDGWVSIRIPESGLPLHEVVEQFAQFNGKEFAVIPKDLEKKKIIMVSPNKTIKIEDLTLFFQVLFFTHDLRIVPMWSSPNEIQRVERLESKTFKQRV